MVPPKGVYLPISKLHLILAIANLLVVHNILWLAIILCASKLTMANIECSFEMGKYTLLGVTFILLLMVQSIATHYLINQESARVINAWCYSNQPCLYSVRHRFPIFSLC